MDNTFSWKIDRLISYMKRQSTKYWHTLFMWKVCNPRVRLLFCIIWHYHEIKRRRWISTLLFSQIFIFATKKLNKISIYFTKMITLLWLIRHLLPKDSDKLNCISSYIYSIYFPNISFQCPSMPELIFKIAIDWRANWDETLHREKKLVHLTFHSIPTIYIVMMSLFIAR